MNNQQYSLEVEDAAPKTEFKSAKSANEALKQFITASHLEETLLAYNNLACLCSVDDADYLSNCVDDTEANFFSKRFTIYNKIKSSTTPVHNLFKLLDAKINEASKLLPKDSLLQDKLEQHNINNNDINYNGNGKLQDICIVGAGPAGLMTAIWCSLISTTRKITVIEKRSEFSRNNVLTLWPFTVSELKSFAAKIFYPKFCSGGLNHIGTRKLQAILLKIALLFNINVIHNVGFDSLEIPTNSSTKKWSIKTTPSLSNEINFDVLIGAGGARSPVSRCVPFQKKTIKAAQAIGITCNFINKKTRAEQVLSEINYSYHYKMNYFNNLLKESGMKLENLVYYRNETHYFVMTVKKQSLLNLSILRENKSNVKELLHKSNIDNEKLLLALRKVATYCGIPNCCPFASLSTTTNADAQLFDFTSKTYSEDTTKFLDVNSYLSYNAINNDNDDCLQLLTEDENNSTPKLVVSLCGDSLVEPFWPMGTGVNRALLSAIDIANMILRYNTINNVVEHEQHEQSASTKLQHDILEEKEEAYSHLRRLFSSGIITSNSDKKVAFRYSKYSSPLLPIEPATRYKQYKKRITSFKVPEKLLH